MTNYRGVLIQKEGRKGDEEKASPCRVEGERRAAGESPGRLNGLGPSLMRREGINAYASVFLASFCMLVIEMVAGRILAPYVGVSLYTWTSIIGVVLAGISAGAYLGGVIADRHPRLSTLGWILFLSGLGAFAIPLSDPLDGRGPFPHRLDGADPFDHGHHLFHPVLLSSEWFRLWRSN